ncbi:hypothetical protein CSB37_01920 [bacterium DOLZORAL124_38_8]|nr:MAG: hypothetical protein CSB37_01920 [bacterium DOLZORAL124_38_8]
MIQSIFLSNFRNHTQKQFQFTTDKVVFWGKNGHGKTNILEALCILSSGKSWRETAAQDLIEHHQTSALIKAQTNQNEYKILIEPRVRKLERNEKKLSFAKHIGQIPSLLFAPEHLLLFHGTKTLRQKFFDRFFCQLSPEYQRLLRETNRAHKHKISVLKSREDWFEIKKSDVEPWNKILAKNIPIIWEMRTNWLQQINQILPTELQHISQKNEPLTIQLTSPETFDPTESGVLHFFDRHFERERASQKNLLAPSRDDFSFTYRHKPLTATASRGEERSILLSLLSAQKQVFFNTTHKYPILLLDDVFSELDSTRQTQLEHICAHTQTFFTTTHKSHFKSFQSPVQEILVE